MATISGCAQPVPLEKKERTIDSFLDYLAPDGCRYIASDVQYECNDGVYTGGINDRVGFVRREMVKHYDAKKNSEIIYDDLYHCRTDWNGVIKDGGNLIYCDTKFSEYVFKEIVSKDFIYAGRVGDKFKYLAKP